MKFVSDNILARTDEGVVLYGGQAKTDGAIVFPMPEGVEGDQYTRVALKSTGTLWSYTVQRFPPKSPPYTGPTAPDAFKPFALGYVELADQIIVEARIVTDDFDALKVGLPMQLTTTPFTTDEAGEPIHTYAFAPITEGAPS